MIGATLLTALFAANLELGGDLGLGRLLGSADAAPGRSGQSLEAVRRPWSMGLRAAYEWLPGHLVGLRYRNWTAEGDVSDAADLGTAPHETLTLQTFGIEYVHRAGVGPIWWRLGGGTGFVFARDALDLDAETIESRGEGMAFWLGSGIELPVGRDLSLHVGASALWASMGSMKIPDQESYATHYDIAQLDAGVSFRL